MAAPEKVKTYLACWLQLGKKLIDNRQQTINLQKPVVVGDSYSTEFETCWQNILEQQGQNYHLEGTEQTLESLFSSKWEIYACARCQMPVPKVELGLQDPNCPCTDLPLWPNTELPLPRPPVIDQNQFSKICDRLKDKNYLN